MENVDLFNVKGTAINKQIEVQSYCSCISETVSHNLPHAGEEKHLQMYACTNVLMCGEFFRPYPQYPHGEDGMGQ